MLAMAGAGMAFSAYLTALEAFVIRRVLLLVPGVGNLLPRPCYRVRLGMVRR